MKKLFTIALILLVTTMGQSQVRKVSKNDAKNNVATMQATKGMESLENSINRPIPPLSEGELDYTIYDWQTNGGPRNWTIVWPDGKVNFAYNIANSESLSDCGTGIGTYDSNTDEWIPSDGRIEIEKTCFGSIARYQNNSIVVAAQTESTCGLYIVEDKDNITPNSVPAVSYLDPTYEPSCPNVMTSGANRDIIHVVATASFTDTCNSVPGADSVIMPIIYFRSMDGGETWDKQNVILPYMDSVYGVYWGQHICYWMETTAMTMVKHGKERYSTIILASTLLSTLGSCIRVGPPVSGAPMMSSVLPTSSTVPLVNLVQECTIRASVVLLFGARACLTMVRPRLPLLASPLS